MLINEVRKQWSQYVGSNTTKIKRERHLVAVLRPRVNVTLVGCYRHMNYGFTIIDKRVFKMILHNIRN